MRYTRFKILRQQRGLLRVEVAQRAGIERGRMSLIENAWVSPTLDELAAIAKALGVPVERLTRAAEEHVA